MAVLALVLILVALVFGFGVLVGNTGPQSLNVFGIDISATSAGIFLAGAATMLVLLSGLWMLQAGARRARRKRAEVKSLRKAASSSPPTAAAERRDVDSPGRRSPFDRDRNAGPDPTREADRR